MRQVNTAAPANLNHPLCQGLELWWLALPHLAKGLTWRDISGKRRDGTLNAIDNSTTTRGWRQSKHACGNMVLTADATLGNGCVITPLTTLATGSTAFTVAVWSSAPANFMAPWSQQDSVPGPALVGASGSVYAEVAGNIYGSVVWPFTNLDHYTMVYDGSGADNPTRLKLYINGLLKTLSYPGTVPTSLTTTATYFRTHWYGGVAGRGNVDDLKVYSRPLSAAQVWSLYTESLAGHPNMLNYRGLNRTAPAAGGAVIPVFMNQYRQRSA